MPAPRLVYATSCQASGKTINSIELLKVMDVWLCRPLVNMSVICEFAKHFALVNEPGERKENSPQFISSLQNLGSQGFAANSLEFKLFQRCQRGNNPKKESQGRIKKNLSPRSFEDDSEMNRRLRYGCFHT